MTEFNTPINPENENQENVEKIQQLQQLEELNKERELAAQNKKFQFYLACFFVIFGAYGFFYTFSSTAFKSKAKLGIHPLTCNKNKVKATATQISLPKKKEIQVAIPSKKSFLSVSSKIHDVDEMVVFSFEDFDPKAKYYLCVDGKKVKSVHSKKFHHTFRSAGNHQVRLHVEYGDEHAVIDEMNLNILAAIPEASSASGIEMD